MHGETVTRVELTISAGQSISNARPAAGSTIKRILVPAGTQGVGLRVLHGVSATGPFLGSRDSSGAAIAIPFTAGDSIEFTAELYAGTRHFQLQTVQADGVTPQTQSADRVFSAVMLG